MSIPKFTIAAIASWLSQRRPKELFFLFTLVAILPALFSVGFHHPDEQFSIIELMNYKLGHVSADIFNWDFHLKIRPFFQVLIYTYFYKVFSFFGAESPFLFAGLLRYFNLVIGITALYTFLSSPSLKDNITYPEGNKRPTFNNLFVLTLLTWFVPYIFVRTSSESFSISLFLFGLSLLLRNNLLTFLGGLLFGLSFASRFQMGIPAFGVFCWFIFIKRGSYWKDALILALGVLGGVVVLALSDYWGYGEWVFSPWNYLRENLIYKKVNSFGVKPFWFFFTKGLVKGGAFPALLSLIAAIIFLKKNPKSLLPWVILPYFLIHNLVGHKEVRFLNFLYILTPIFLILIWREWEFRFKRPLMILATVVNAVLLIRALFFPVYKPLLLYKTIYHRIPKEKVIYTPQVGNEPHLTLQMRFYVKDQRKLIPLSLGEIKELSHQNEVLVLTSRFLEKEILDGEKCEAIDSLYPEWIYDYNYFNWLKRSAVWVLWKCGP